MAQNDEKNDFEEQSASEETVASDVFADEDETSEEVVIDAETSGLDDASSVSEIIDLEDVPVNPETIELDDVSLDFDHIPEEVEEVLIGGEPSSTDDDLIGGEPIHSEEDLLGDKSTPYDDVLIGAEASTSDKGDTKSDKESSGSKKDTAAKRPSIHRHQMNDSQAKVKQHFTKLNFVSRIIIGFALVSASTAFIAIFVVAIVWGQYFQIYTAENMETLAATTSNRIASAYESNHEFNDEVLEGALQSSKSSDEVGVRVLDTSGQIVFDSMKFIPPELADKYEPDNATQVAMSNITVDGEVVGSVRVWVYGSTTLMSRLDAQFRDNTYRALLLASAVAIVIASLLGFFFARTLVSPINKIMRTAEELSKGDYNARTKLEGEDEVSQLGMTLDDMADSIERDRELERRLTSDVAHELRTPLMAIQATVEAMIDGVYEVDTEHLALVDSEVRRLSRLVDALLKLSRLENRTQPFKEEVLNLGTLIEGIVIAHEVFVVESGLSIEYHAEPNVCVIGDPDKIRQAVANLISNAVRYTPEGGSIYVDVRREGRAAAIDVADTGIGLTPEEEQMVFSRFWRADAGRNRESGGLGIGLAVVKEIVDRHKGRVLVYGEKGAGSTFTILLPIYDESSSREQSRRGSRNRDYFIGN